MLLLFCFSELKNDDEIIPIAAGIEPEIRASFPLGKPENNYTMEVHVKVMDSYALSAKYIATVRVSENNVFD